jgi:hypothetical protein
MESKRSWSFQSVCDLFECAAVDVMALSDGAVHVALNESQ